MTDLDSMHYDRTGKNHRRDSQEFNEDDEETVGDADLWNKLETL